MNSATDQMVTVRNHNQDVLTTLGTIPVSGGGTGGTTAQSGLSNLFGYSLGSAAPIVIPCTGGGDESALSSANALAARNTAMLLPMGTQPCQMNNRWQMNNNGYSAIMTWGGGPQEINTANNAVPRMIANTDNIAQNAPAQGAIDMNGPRALTWNSTNMYGTNIAAPAALIYNSAQSGICCASNVIDAINASFGNANAFLGCPIDGLLNCIQAGGVYTGTITNGGSGYVDGTYTGVSFTGGSGTTAVAATITVVGTSVTSVVLGGQFWSDPGKNYVVGDNLSASNTNLGGSGSGFVFNITRIMKATPTAANTLPRITKSQISDVACGLCLNFSDTMIYDSEFTGITGTAIQPIFGGGGMQIGFNRFEFHNFGIMLGGPNAAGAQNGGTYVIGSSFDSLSNQYDTAWRVTDHRNIQFGGGDGFIAVGNSAIRTRTTVSPYLAGGGPVALKNALWVGNVDGSSLGGGLNQHCYEIKNSSGAVTPDYVVIVDNICNTGATTSPVLFTNIPAHFVVDNSGPGGEHWEQGGRKWGINTLVEPTFNFESLSDVSVNGSSSGKINLHAQAASGTWEFDLPTTAGTAGSVLTSQAGAGTPMTWTDPAISGRTKFTTSGGGCTVTGTTGGATAGSFTTSTTGTCTTTITMNGATGLTAPNGWSCWASDITSGIAGAQSGSSATTAALKIVTTSGDTVNFGCMGF